MKIYHASIVWDIKVRGRVVKGRIASEVEGEFKPFVSPRLIHVGRDKRTAECAQHRYQLIN